MIYRKELSIPNLKKNLGNFAYLNNSDYRMGRFSIIIDFDAKEKLDVEYYRRDNHRYIKIFGNLNGDTIDTLNVSNNKLQRIRVISALHLDWREITFPRLIVILKHIISNYIETGNLIDENTYRRNT